MGGKAGSENPIVGPRMTMVVINSRVCLQGTHV